MSIHSGTRMVLLWRTETAETGSKPLMRIVYCEFAFNLEIMIRAKVLATCSCAVIAVLERGITRGVKAGA